MEEIFNNNLLESPIFISGHPRSGTNLLMRLLDGSTDLLSPPGVGKLHILRRLSFNSGFINESSTERKNRLFSTIELQLDSPKSERFQKLLEDSIAKTTTIGFKSDVGIIIDAIMKYTEASSGIKRWTEKNHNLEFYWARAMFAFSNPILLVMVRDPRDVWASWRELCKRYGMDTGQMQMRRNVQQHLFEELIETNLGISRFENIEAIFDYYKVPEKNKALLNELTTKVLFNGINSNDVNCEVIDIDAFSYSDVDAGRMAWNHKIISERSMWLAKNFKNNVKVISYEGLTNNPKDIIDSVSRMCKIASPKTIAPTEVGQTWAGNSSFSDNLSGVSTQSVGRWKEKLNAEEVDAIENVAIPSYNLALAQQQ